MNREATDARSVSDPYVRERILNLALEVSAATSLNQILTRALSRVDELVPFDLATIALIDEDRSDLVFREMNYRRPGQGGRRSMVGQRLPINDDNVFGWVARHGRPHLRRSLDEEFPFQRLQDDEEVVSHVIVPVIGQQQIIGVLAVGSLETDSYDEVDMAMAAQFARLVGLAVANLRTHQQVTELALRDGLTGAYNHRHFQDVLGAELHRLDRYGEEIALMLMDVDNFKSFNDRHGHPVGDQILKQTVRVLRKHLRGSDLIFRYGGEEFAVLLPGTGLEAASIAAEKLNHAMRRENRYRARNGTEEVVTVSIGVSCAAGGKTREQLIGEADQALYQAKHGGKDTSVAAGDH